VREIVGPDGSVLGVDLDGQAVAFANQRRLANGLTNVAFINGDARSVQFERLFDAAVGRFVLMFISDSTAALRVVASKVREGGVLAFHEWAAGTSPASAMNLPVLSVLLDLMVRTFERSGARRDIGAELYWRMREAGLDPEPRPVAEISVSIDQGEIAWRRWALFARSLRPKMLEYGLATEKQFDDLVERQLRDELRHARGVVPMSWLMVGQWARK